MHTHEENKDIYKYSYPNGWLIKAFRDLNVPKKDHQQAVNFFEDYYQEKRKRQQKAEQGMAGMPFFTGSRDVAYGNYDRIQITPVGHLFDFTREANQTHDWLGSSQSILLYKWKKGQSRRCFQSIVKKGTRKAEIGVVDADGKKRKNEFLAVTFCYISDDMRSRVNTSYSDILDRCENQICGLVDAFNQRLNSSSEPDDRLHNKVYAEVFGSLSAAEIVILWSAKQYTDVMYLIDCVRDFHYKWKDERVSLFRTTYTLITFPVRLRHENLGKWADMRDSSLNDILGEASIQFATQDGAGDETFEPFTSFFNNCIQNASEMLGESSPPSLDWIRCAGEYDLLVKVQSKYVTRLFSNPQNWHDQDDHAWVKAPELHDAACSVYHPTFNRHILYTFTRLSYQKDRDLPVFARGEDDEWEYTRKHLECITNVPLKESSLQNRMNLIGAIKQDQKQLDELLKLVQARIPMNSNLSTELNQLFSDYAQCMCASADGLWIEDYQELYRQMLEQLIRQIGQIDVWEQYSGQANDNAWEDRWDAARSVVKDIIELIRSLHRQTNHISTSSKLFFREQETHFGYSAQHDLVLHAYYDIVKHLIKLIYDYSDKSFQSTLYPLVNFQAGDHIESDIYYEERAELYLKTGCVLHPRIMVIHIPLDGMDNLMYYIPMMVHEVFHYAAPRDRRSRNQILAKASVYLILEYSLGVLFCDLFQVRLDEAEARMSADKRRSKGQIEEVQLKAEKTFRERICSVLYRFAEKHIDTIYQSIESVFFTSEMEGMSREDFAKLETVPDLNELREMPILRSWFLTWLENWLLGFEIRNKNGKADAKAPTYIGLGDLFEPLFRILSDTLPQEVKVKQEAVPDPDITVYNQVIDLMKEQIDFTLNSEDKLSEDNTPINQQIMKGVQDYIDSGRFSDLLKQLDEIFPDIAMVTLTKMPASGYMLQIAMDLDKQMYSCNTNVMNDVRFAAVLHWLIDHSSAKSGKAADICLEQELESFQKLYHASYEIIAITSGGIDEGLTRRAECWSNAFRKEYYHYCRNAPINLMQDWVKTLIQEQMIPCLKLEGDTKGRIVQLFQHPYRDYLHILLEKEVGENTLSELFQLSIRTVLQFQRYQPLKQLNDSFQTKMHLPMTHSSMGAVKPKSDLSHYGMKLLYGGTLLSAIHKVMYKLYRYREADHVDSSTGMWYRGVSNADNNVLPSGFVHFAEDAGLLNGGLNVSSNYSYLDAQRHNYESFRYSAEGSIPDISPAQYQCAFNYLTLMQHYSQHTNLLDWSEDFFAATYFALESQINLNDCYPYDQKKQIRERSLKDADKDAALYILDPVRFNLACQAIENEINGLFHFDSPAILPTGNEVPNLSIPENQKRMSEYHNLYPDSTKAAKKVQGILSLTKADGKTDTPVTLIDLKKNRKPTEKLTFHLPRAVYAAKLNARIRAQSGLFVAFSLMSNPVVWEGKSILTEKLNPHLFHYQALEQIQDYYLEMSRKHQPFMMKIRLPSSAKLELGRMFYHFGLSKERIYPELQNNRNR